MAGEHPNGGHAGDGLTRRGAIVLGGTVVASIAIPGLCRAPVARAQQGAVPRFEDVNGFALGDREATAAQLDDYVQRVAAASPRVQTALLGLRTVEGRPLRYAVVSHPDNLARLDEIAARIRRLRLKPPSAAEAARAASELPAFVAVVANVHGNEPSGADAVAKMLFELAARDDAVNLRRLRELICVFVVVQNPDGRDADRRVNARAFDLNRDWFAFTQPETEVKVGLYSRFPPIVAVDAHEQFASAPDTFFFPPDNDPVHHEASRAGLDASNQTVTPAIEAAFKAKGYRYEHYGIYDVFYPGYGDIAPNHAFGAAGVLFEMENSNVYPEKVARQFTATEATIDATAAAKEKLLVAWAAQWPQAAAQGRAGRLSPNVTQNPENPPPSGAVPDDRIYGYALRTTAHTADAAHLVDRLRVYDVEVYVTRRSASVARLRPFGDTTFAPATLGRGTIVIPASQPMKRWVHILLADDPYAALPYFYDVSGWSNPAMMGLSGGAVGVPLSPLLKRPRRTRRQIARHVKPRAATLHAIDRASELQGGLRTGRAGYAFALDAALAQAAVFGLLADGVDVRRAPGAVAGLPAGAAVVPASARSAVVAAGRRFGIRATPLADAPSGLEPVRRPTVAVYFDAGSDVSERLFASSRGFARWLLDTRFGLDVRTVSSADLEAGVLASGVDALIVPDGLATVIPAGVPNVAFSPPGGGIGPNGLREIQAFVTRGGTFAGWRTQGVAVARAAGIAGDLRTRSAPSGFTVPGLPVAVELRGDDPAVRGLGATSFVYNVADPILVGGGETIVRYPDRLRALGYAEDLEAVNGTVAGTALRIGRGRSYVFSFDPAYRGYVEATQRLIGALLLTVPAAAPAARAASALPVRRDRQAETTTPLRMVVVRVGPDGARTLRAVVAAVTGLPGDLALRTLADGSLEARAIDRDPLSGHTAAWAQRLLGDLHRAGGQASLVVA